MTTTRRGSLSIWFDPEKQLLAVPTGKRGRQTVFTDAAIQACLTLKALFGLPLRQTTGMVASLLELAVWIGRCLTLAPCAAARRC